MDDNMIQWFYRTRIKGGFYETRKESKKELSRMWKGFFSVANRVKPGLWKVLFDTLLQLISSKTWNATKTKNYFEMS